MKSGSGLLAHEVLGQISASAIHGGNPIARWRRRASSVSMVDTFHTDVVFPPDAGNDPAGPADEPFAARSGRRFRGPRGLETRSLREDRRLAEATQTPVVPGWM